MKSLGLGQRGGDGDNGPFGQLRKTSQGDGLGCGGHRQSGSVDADDAAKSLVGGEPLPEPNERTPISHGR